MRAMFAGGLQALAQYLSFTVASSAIVKNKYCASAASGAFYGTSDASNQVGVNTSWTTLREISPFGTPSDDTMGDDDADMDFESDTESSGPESPDEHQVEFGVSIYEALDDQFSMQCRLNHFTSDAKGVEPDTLYSPYSSSESIPDTYSSANIDNPPTLLAPALRAYLFTAFSEEDQAVIIAWDHRLPYMSAQRVHLYQVEFAACYDISPTYAMNEFKDHLVKAMNEEVPCTYEDEDEYDYLWNVLDRNGRVQRVLQLYSAATIESMRNIPSSVPYPMLPSPY